MMVEGGYGNELVPPMAGLMGECSGVLVDICLGMVAYAGVLTSRSDASRVEFLHTINCIITIKMLEFFVCCYYFYK